MTTAMRPGPAPADAGQAMMQAIVQRRYGTAPEDVLRLEQTARPAVKADEVLVRVRAASVDRGTWHLMAGLPYLARFIGFGLRGPKIPVPGWAVAYWANEPWLVPNTSSPGSRPVTSWPTASTVPATASPGTGVFGPRSPKPMIRIR